MSVREQFARLLRRPRVATLAQALQWDSRAAAAGKWRVRSWRWRWAASPDHNP